MVLLAVQSPENRHHVWQERLNSEARLLAELFMRRPLSLTSGEKSAMCGERAIRSDGRLTTSSTIDKICGDCAVNKLALNNLQSNFSTSFGSSSFAKQPHFPSSSFRIHFLVH